MAAQIQSRSNYASSTSDAGSFNVSASLPSGILPGNLLIAVVSVDEAPTVSASAGWNKLGQASNSTIVTGAIFWKRALGGGLDTLTITTSTNQQISAVFLCCTGGLGILGESSNGSSTNSNPTNKNMYLSKDYLWIATRSGDSTVVATGAPSGYSNLQTKAAGGTSGASTNTAEKTSTARQEDPGTFTSNTEQWVCWTIGVVPDDGTPVILDVSTGSVSGNAVLTVSATMPTGWGNTAVLAMLQSYTPTYTDRAINSVTYNSDAMTLIDSEDNVPTGDGSKISAYIRYAPDEGSSLSCTCTRAGAVDNQSMAVYTMANVNTSQPDSSAKGERGATSPFSMDITTITPSSLIFSSHDAGLNCAVSGSQIVDATFFTAYVLYGHYMNTTPGTYSWTETCDAVGDGPMLMVAIRPAFMKNQIYSVQQAVKRAAFF